MPRIDPITEAGDSGEVQQVFDQLVTTRGLIPTMYGILAHHPEILVAHRAYFHAALDSGTLDRSFKEKIALRTAVACGSSYSSASHRRYALEHGVAAGVLDKIEVGDYATLGDRERAALVFADEAVSSSPVSEASFANLATHFDAAQIVEISALIGVMILASTLGKIFDLEPDDGVAGR
jgi:4-carboxymuconolactone decarboxylase